MFGWFLSINPDLWCFLKTRNCGSGIQQSGLACVCDIRLYTDTVNSQYPLGTVSSNFAIVDGTVWLGCTISGTPGTRGSGCGCGK